MTGKHDCDPSAICHDNEQSFSCECPAGFIDRSPNKLHRPGRVCVKLVDECATGRHTCSAQADCRDLEEGYTCECREGYVDRSPNLASQPGRVCSAPEVCPSNHECSSAAVCEPLGGNKYQCSCIQGYIDQSPNGQKGRICVRRVRSATTKPGDIVASVLEDSLTDRLILLCEEDQNDCHSAAICSEVSGPEKYTCQCRDGYIDQSPNRNTRPGRICVEMVNECLDRSLNDCHSLAICEDKRQGYTCRCPVNTVDKSSNPNKPGRLCVKQINECRNPSLNTCSRFAECIDKENGYECRCKPGYHDNDPSHPGTQCSYIINECDSPNLNDCDRNAICIDSEGGYDCKCKPPYRDESPSGHPGRVCRLNECLDVNLNNCDKNAECQDMDDGYICSCREGYYDQSPNPQEPGRVCLEFQVDHKVEQVTITPVQSHPLNEGLPCGRDFCKITMGEVCISGSYCGCRPGESRSVATGKCERVEETPLQIRVVSRDSTPLLYSSEYGSTKSPPYVEIVDLFQKDMARTFGGTIYAPRYVNTKVEYITHPKTVNSSWPDGLLFKYDVQTTPSKQQPVDKCEVWKQMMASLQRTNGVIGGGSLRIADDSELLNPCRAEEPVGECGGHDCKTELGEICIAGSVCGCPVGMRRAASTDVCRAVESWNVPLWVIRKDYKNLVYNDSFANPLDSIYKSYVQDYEKGIAGCYPHTTLRNAFVAADVNEIVNPKVFLFLDFFIS
ncbi:calcium binding EGF domain protein [Ancylostoma duodenale]|uniref:Calcium binding EGF domain protein n=1 Tax=Ancylostoma duodenale TaxID=51022 RepID=A0A0C2G492_9BILA|nr:calcium binding EGF domain protein [Ancylostoma duodenale]